MQVQFKQPPSGVLYIGGEVPSPMKLGFFTGGLTKIILGVLQSLVTGLHYSFGTNASSGDPAAELPHICFPLYSAVDQFVATPQGQSPPLLGASDFGESKAAAAARRKTGAVFYAYNTRDTYSFHFHSFFLDFATSSANWIGTLFPCPCGSSTTRVPRPSTSAASGTSCTSSSGNHSSRRRNNHKRPSGAVRCPPRAPPPKAAKAAAAACAASSGCCGAPCRRLRRSRSSSTTSSGWAARASPARA